MHSLGALHSKHSVLSFDFLKFALSPISKKENKFIQINLVWVISRLVFLFYGTIRYNNSTAMDTDNNK